MRKSITFSLDENILGSLVKRAEKHNLSTSRELENILKKALRL